MSKVLIGVGVGCGAVVFIGVIALVAGGMWAKEKIDDVTQSGDTMQGLEQRVTALDQRYAFSEPPKGQQLELTEGRLQDYLRIRMALKPVLEAFEVKARQFAPQKGEQVGLTKSLQAVGMMNELRADLSEKWLAELERQKMSPREFHAVTATVYTSAWSKAKGELSPHERTRYEQLKSELQKQANDPNLPETAREPVQQQLAQTEKKLAALPSAGTAPSGDLKIFATNAALVEKYKKRIEGATSAGLDLFLVGNTQEMGTALQEVLGGAANSPDPAPAP
jgi:hypothetical protein